MASTSTYSTYIGKSATGGFDQVVAETFSFAYDATPNAMAVYTSEHLEGGHLSGVGVVFGPVTLPNSITVTIKDNHGVTIASGTLTATGRLESFSPQPFVGPLSVYLTGNTTPGAVGELTLYAF
ncbi:MAG: hypothetical protein Q8K92_26260 [Leadbetterella sp.]|nr:hypothetical protein [Leadbetterella sp.]